MTKKSVLICEYCGKVIDQEKRFIHEVHRNGDEVEHDEYYHQECFINSTISEFEKLGFEIIRPRSEINPNLEEDEEEDDLSVENELIGSGLSLLSDLISAGKEMGMANHSKPEEKKKETKNKISPDFIGDDPEKMKIGTINPPIIETKTSQSENGNKKREPKKAGIQK